VPVGSVTGDDNGAVDDVTGPPAGALTVAALVIAAAVFVDAPESVAAAVVMLAEPGDVIIVEVIEELTDPGADVLLLGVDGELIDERDEVDAVCVNSSAIPLLPSTDPVWTLAIGLHGIEGVLIGGGV
jgi:hypothetical protein